MIGAENHAMAGVRRDSGGSLADDLHRSGLPGTNLVRFTEGDTALMRATFDGGVARKRTISE